MKQYIMIALVSTILSACGDGGGGGATNTAVSDGGGGNNGGGGNVNPTPNPDPNPGGGNNGGVVRPFQQNQLASGLNRVRFSGRNQKIGILEDETVSNTTPAEYRGRIEYGIGAQGGQFPFIFHNQNPGRQPNNADSDHADMVTSIAIGKTFGIAYRAKAVDYDYNFNRNSRREDRSHIDLGGIYTDAKRKNLVAMNNSWRTLPNLRNVQARNGFNNEQVRELQAAALSLGYDAAGDGPGNDSVGLILSKQCDKYRRHLQLARDGFAVYTILGDNPGDPRGEYKRVSQQQLQALYDIRCKTGYSDYADRSLYNKYVGADFIRKIEADADADRDAPIWVWGAGNDRGENPTLQATLPAVIRKAEQYWLAVTAIEYSGGRYRQTDYANACGQARNYCLAAVVNGTQYIDYLGNRGNSDGTSAAAPQVTAGLAVIKQAFPSKDRRWARRRMLATASHTTADGQRLRDRNGNIVRTDGNGTSAIFGRGIMRMDLAIQPLGRSMLSVDGDSLGIAKTYYVKDSFIQSSGVFGDGVKLGLNTINTQKFDIMGAEFKYNMGDSVFIKNTPQQNKFFNFTGNMDYTPVASRMGKSRLSFIPTTPSAFNNLDYTEDSMPFKPLVNGQANQPIKMSYAVSDTISMQMRVPLHSENINSLTTQFTYAPIAKNTVFSAGVHTEQGTILGANFLGAYGGLGRANTAFVQTTKHSTIGKWAVRYNATLTTTSTNGFTNRTIQRINGLTSSGFSVIANRQYKTGKLGFAVYQPLRLDNGTMDVKFVDKVTDNTKLSYDTKTVNMTPSARQLTLETYYDFTDSPFTIKTKLTQNNGHVRGNNDNTILLRYYKPFNK